MNRNVRVSIASAVASVLMSASVGFAGKMDPIELSIILSYNAQVIHSSPESPESYAFFGSADVTGFSDPGNLGNIVRMRSPNGAFMSESRPDGGFSSSIGYAQFGDLASSLLEPGPWVIEVLDGGSGQTFTYTYSLDVSGLTADHMRPISFTGIQSGQTISQNPTFDWTIPPSTDPAIQYQDAFPLLARVGGSGFLPGPTITTSDTSWSPDGPLEPGVYDMILQFQTFPASDILIPSTPVPDVGSPEFVMFSYDVGFSSYAAVSGLVVVPAPASVLVLAGSLMVMRRRRG